MQARLRRLLFSLGWIYLVLLLLIAAFQRKLLFFPTRAPEPEMLAAATTLGLEPWRDASGAVLGWKRHGKASASAAHKLLVFHGNAGYALHRDNYLRAFESIETGRQWEVWLFEYPGYGARGGSPGRDAFAKAGREAVAQLRALDARPLFLLGESLGTGVACDLAAEETNAIAGLVLVTPFARLTDVAQMHFPFLPVRLILRDRWDNLVALAGFHGPVAAVIAQRDEVLSAAQGELLFDKISGPKRCWRLPGATHNSSAIHDADWAGEVSDFLIAPGETKR